MLNPSVQKIATVIFFLTVFLASLFVISNQWSADELASDSDQFSYCPVMGLELHGELFTYDTGTSESSSEDGEWVDGISSDDLMWAINDADENSEVSAIVLEIDSYGGSAVAGEEVAAAIKKATKPVVAVIRGAGTSAAYWSATGADYIVASANSDVGAIGATSSYLESAQKNNKDGLTYVDLRSAPYKDMGDPDRALSSAEKVLWQRDLDIIHKNFVQAVAENRKLDLAKVEKLADGSSMLGQLALDNGLIDKIGGRDEAIQYLVDQGVISETEDICWY